MKSDKPRFAPECDVKYSMIRSISEKVTEKNKALSKGEKVINLSLGQNFIGNPQPVFEKIKWFKEGRVKNPILYQPSLGPPDIREKIGKNFYPHFYDIPEGYYSPKNIMITDGAFGAGRNAIGSIMERGDLLVIDRFTFRYFINTIQILGRGDKNGIKPRVKVIPSTRREGFMSPPEQTINFLSDLEEKHPDKKIVYYTQFGVNPTGYFRKEEELREIAQFIGKDPSLFLINDIAYHLTRWKHENQIPLASYLAEENQGIVDIDTLSKPFGLMGARAGSLLTKDRELFEKSARVQQYSIVSPNKFAVDVWNAVGNYVHELTGELEELSRRLKERKTMMEKELEKVGLEKFTSSYGALYCFMKVPEESSTLWKRLINEAKVAVIPGTAFTRENDPEGENYVRITISMSKEIIEQAIKRLTLYFTRHS